MNCNSRLTDGILIRYRPSRCCWLLNGFQFAQNHVYWLFSELVTISPLDFFSMAQERVCHANVAHLTLDGNSRTP